MLCIIRTKACKRCGGDISLECDIYGTYAQCIQCGNTLNDDEFIKQASQKFLKIRSACLQEPVKTKNTAD